jgi:hypothetical protein
VSTQQAKKPDARAQTSPANGALSSGPKTSNGKLACALAAVEHGVYAWSPVLPGETEADWTGLLNGCREAFRPVGEPENQLVYSIAMTFLQMHRLHRREKEVSLERMKVDAFSDMEKEHVAQQIDVILDGKGAELRLEISVLNDLIANLEALPEDPPETPLAEGDAQLILDWIVQINVPRKHLRQGESIITPPSEGWTKGSMREAVGELAKALSKSTEALIINTLERATEELDEKRAKLQTAWHYIEHDSLPKPETAALLNLYDRRLLNTLTRLYNLLERMQGSRLGKPIVPTVPVDVTITHDGNGDV